MAEGHVRLKIRQKIGDGSLPCEPHPKTWAGAGRGESCDGCEERVLASEVEFEVDLLGGKTLRFHRACFAMWHIECAELLRQ
jgi:hypothetical protein